MCVEAEESFAPVWRNVSVEADRRIHTRYNAFLPHVQRGFDYGKGSTLYHGSQFRFALVSDASLVSRYCLNASHLLNIRVFPVNSSGSQIND